MFGAGRVQVGVPEVCVSPTLMATSAPFLERGSVNSDGVAQDAACDAPPAILLPVDEAGASLVPPSKSSRKCSQLVKSLGPGLMVCLADTDGGCLVTAAQSGAEYGYTLLLLQFILVPILYWAQELTVRLAIVKRMGLTELVRHHFGWQWAWAACATLVITCIGAIISEMSSIAGVMKLYDVPVWASCTGVLLVLLAVVVLSGTYRKVELVGVFFGAFELVFLYTMFATRPDPAAVWDGLWTFRLDDPKWMGLVAANIGAVIMPWMLYYQQSAICDKKMGMHELGFERIDTGIGAALTQLIMSAMLISVAATRGASGQKIERVAEIAYALNGTLGEAPAAALVTIGVNGASLVAALVSSLAASWAVSEALGQPRSLSMRLSEAKAFYSVYGLVCAVGFAVTVSGVSIVRLNIFIEQLNAIFMVPVIGGLFFLASRRGILPEEHRVKGPYAWLIGTVFLIVAVFSVYCTVTGNL